MSGKFLARASALSLAVLLAACGGDDDSAPIVNVGSDGSNPETSTGGDDSTGNNSGDDEASNTSVIALGTGSEGNFTQGQIEASTTNLAPGENDALLPGGKAVLQVSIVDQQNGNTLLTGEEMSVSFTSRCVDQGRATLSANPVTASSGIAQTTYTAAGCVGDDLVTARAAGAEASVMLNVEASEPLAFVTLPPEPNSISPTDTSGNATEARAPVSDVPFRLIDENRNGVEQQNVTFRLFPADSDSTLSSETGTTDSEGYVSAVVRAGSTHEVVRVIASTTNSEGEPIETTSAPIAINSYIPTERNFALGLNTFLPDAWRINGTQVEVRVDAADRKGNAIRGNTIINFTTSNGKITPDCELNDSGTCTVTWESLNTREARPEIVAYTQGERLISGTDCHLPSSDCSYEFATLENISTLVQSSSDNVQVTLTDAGGGEYCASTSTTINDEVDGPTTVAPPSGTTIEFSTTAGTIITESQASKTIGSGKNLVAESAYVACVDAEADATATEPSILKVVVTPPGGNPVEDFVNL
ncbi:MAG: hypothetical protein ABJM11_08200 [Marinobacter sp.]|uniref:hypothetical protein n=1 Tax=Marinobacter sp. TaxID=50741 RepID=UPI003297A010